MLRAHQLRLVIETGTYLGDMAAFLAQRGYFVITIELDAQLASFARRRFNRNKNIRVVEGDSGSLMRAIIEQVEGPALFYLDGHDSGPGTATGDCETPVIAEISAILERASAGSVVVIDDARCFGTEPGYPALAEFKNFLPERGVSDATVANDAIVFALSGKRAGASVH